MTTIAPPPLSTEAYDSLAPYYDEFTAGYAHDPTGREALEKTMGIGLSEVQKTWMDWLLDRPDSGPGTRR